MKSARRRSLHHSHAASWTALLLLWLAVSGGVAWGVGEAARNEATALLEQQSESAAALHAAVLRSELEKYHALPPALATDPDVSRLLLNRHSDPDALNRRLENLAGQTRASAIYVIGADGVTYAASNWNQPVSFMGTNYSFRRYFVKAMRDGSAEFFALGATSGKPGLFLSRRIVLNGRHLGVVVVKVEFDALESEWRASGEPAYVVDPGGVVLITNIPQWRFRTLRPMNAESRQLTLADQTLGDGTLEPLPFLTPEDGATRLVRTGQAGTGQQWMHARIDTITPGWTLHLLAPEKGAINANVMNARVLAILISTLVSGIAAFLLRRRQQTAARQRAAESARQELERLIDERTRDLSQANAALNLQIEERMRAEASREALRDELVQAGKLAALGQIAASIAHEINQPVAAIRTQADTASAWLIRDQTPRAMRALQRIGDLTMRIGAITEELRAFARKAEPQVHPTSLDEAVDGALLLLGGRLRQDGIRLTRNSEGDFQVLADRFRLEQVIVNLMQNAAEALDSRADSQIVLTTRQHDDWIILTVADNGPGIPHEVQDQLFTPFVTSKPKGLGLGLVICRDIVSGFGGELDLHPSSTGTVFAISLMPA
ncbi:sensor histidine kinase [Brevundimonas diminuta]|uniref:sensor histidine kinase n=1 Tax=Brevundimonas diminuta TaxID=293 RepID=UPI003D02BE06